METPKTTTFHIAITAKDNEDNVQYEGNLGFITSNLTQLVASGQLRDELENRLHWFGAILSENITEKLTQSKR